VAVQGGGGGSCPWSPVGRGRERSGRSDGSWCPRSVPAPLVADPLSVQEADVASCEWITPSANRDDLVHLGGERMVPVQRLVHWVVGPLAVRPGAVGLGG